MSQDQIAIPRNWTFEKAEIAAAFDRHVREQLPWYDLATGAIAHIARHYIPAGGLVYDIGASTGNIGRALSETLKDRRARLVAIEAAAEMVVRYDGPGEVIQADAMAFDFEPFDLGVCFLLLMFLPVSRRAAFVQKLRQRIKPGGALIIFDKCEAATGYPATVLWRLTLAGKVSAGVDPAEIVAKELSLGGVQRPIADGRRSGDFSPIIDRKKQEMASVALADFILLGHNNKGALNLSTDKTNLLREAVMSYLRGIAALVNRVVIPRLWAVNGLPRDTMPKAVPGDLDKANLQVLGAFLTAMTGAGMVMNDALEDALRAAANLPLKPKELEGQGDEGGSAVNRPGKGAAPARRPKRLADAPADDDGLVDAAPDVPTGKASRAAGVRASVSKAAPEDIAALGALGPDDPVYREALAVLAGGEIPESVEKAEGGLPGAGQSPFDTDGQVAKHNPYHDARGRFTFGPESGSGSGGGSLKDFFESEASGIVVVARLPADIQAHFAAKTTRVFLSSDTRDSHKKHGWTAEDLARLQTVLDRGEVRTDKEFHVVAAHQDGEWWYAAVKVTKDGKEVYLKSFHVMRKKQVIDFPKKGTLVRPRREF